MSDAGVPTGGGAERTGETTPVTDLAQLETPALVLEATTLEANLRAMLRRATDLGVRLRHHAKTHKSLDLARLHARLAGEGAPPLTVSTLREADRFAAGGFHDLLYAVGIAPNKLPHAAKLLRQGIDLQLIADNLETARHLVTFARQEEVRIPVLIEVDCDGHRAGVDPDSSLLLDLAAVLARAPLSLRGVMTHAGSSYDCANLDEIRTVAIRERDGLVHAASRLRQAGHEVPTVSLGSTPTALLADDLTGVTELRAGVYTFFDLVMHGLGVCALEEIALSVLTSVIGHQAEKGWVLIDAGWMALSRDRGTAKQRIDQGYGLVCDVSGRPLTDLIVRETNQEHGIVTARDGSRLRPVDFPVGTLLRILPNHACATAAQHPGYVLLRGTTRIEGYWRRLA